MSYSQESRVTSIFLGGAFWGIAVMTGAAFEWEVHQWTGKGLTLVTVIKGVGGFDAVMAQLLRTGRGIE